MVGYSLDSSEVSIRAASIPDTPVTPSTAVDGDNVLFTWTAPYNGGSPLTRYTIMIQNSDGTTFDESILHCDGTDSTILSNAQCTVPISALQSVPFNLPWGSAIYVKVSATNVVGTSEFSPLGNGAVILKVPDAPTDLTNELSITM